MGDHIKGCQACLKLLLLKLSKYHSLRKIVLEAHNQYFTTKKDIYLNSKDLQNLIQIKMASVSTNSKTTKSPGKKATATNSEPVSAEDMLRKKWQKKTQYEHIRDLPDTYIGSINKDLCDQYVAGIHSQTAKPVIYKKRIEYVPGFYKIYDEIIVNANDNRNRIQNKIDGGEKGHIKMTTLRVKVAPYEDARQPRKMAISVWNDGDGIDVAMHPDEKIYVPEMIFGHLLTSGNYDKAEEKITGGKNGYGAKLANIFSTYFKIETADHNTKQRYTQVFRNMMLEKETPVIEPYKGSPFTCITFVPDYEKFGLTDMTDDLLALFKKRAYDMIFCSQGQIQVYWNDQLLNMADPQGYMKMYLQDNLDTLNQLSKSASAAASSPSSTPAKSGTGDTGADIAAMDKQLTVDDIVLAYSSPHARWQIGACMSPNFQFQQVSFVNGICTSRGGKHVEYVVKQITAKLVNWIGRKHKVVVRDAFIRDNLMVFVNSIIVNPAFDSQTKETLTTNMRDFGSKIEDIPDDFIEILAKSGIADRAVAQNQFQESQALKKTDGKKTRRITDIPKLTDAGFAGDSKHSGQCTLILTEGDSAKAMAISGISVLKDGSDYFGVFPLRGKLMNTRDKSDTAIANNVEITNLKRILGLQEGEVYADTKKLRYGRIMIMTDADVDGSHIKGLLMNYISCHFGSLLKIPGFITALLTPIVKATKGSGKKAKTHQFYNGVEFQAWLNANHGGRSYKIKYYKGLGTSNPQEAKEYFKEFKQTIYQYDDRTENTIDKAFNGDRADDRKAWIQGYTGQILDNTQSGVPFADFIDKDMILFSIADNVRSIPNLMDGLKPSLRKILYSCFTRKLTDEIKVSQLAGYVSEKSAYHHGEASLFGAIINMAQNFCGTNNINLLYPSGQFGSRLQGGNDSAAPRYIFTRLNTITSRLFPAVDEALYKYNEDDGTKIEPVYYAPILPMVLVNGAAGIGTGWSCELPQFNPLDILKVLRGHILAATGKLDKVPHLMSDMMPWYRGFKGTITKLGKNRWITRGVYRRVDNKTIEVSELPIGFWTQDFKELLNILSGQPSTAAGDKGSSRVRGRSPKKSGVAADKEKAAAKKKKNAELLSIPVGTKAAVIAAGDEPLDLNSPDLQLIKNYREMNSECEVKVQITFDPRILTMLLTTTDPKTGITELEKRLRLTSTISCNKTLNFFGPDERLYNMTSVDDIMDMYFTERMKLYRVRKMFLESQYQRDLALLSARAKFILDVVEGRVVVNRRAKPDIILQLQKLEYPVMFEKQLYTPAAFTAKLAELGDTDGSLREKGSYQFLLDMPIYNLTEEKIRDLMTERDEVQALIAVLKGKTPGDLWMEDLDAFEEEYARFMAEYYEYNGLDPAAFGVALSARNIGRIVMKGSVSGGATNTASPSPATNSVVAGDDI
jgi:DNA topoisomerase-2